MAEIKSTLDLVMEKTRHLSFSESEKTEKKMEETKTIVRGIITRFENKTLKAEEVKRELAALSLSNKECDVYEIMKSEVFSKINIGQDNTALFFLIDDFFGINSHDMQTIQLKFQQALENAMTSHISSMRKQLAETCHISGSAVTPNPFADVTFHDLSVTLKTEHQQLLDRKKAELLNSL